MVIYRMGIFPWAWTLFSLKKVELVKNQGVRRIPIQMTTGRKASRLFLHIFQAATIEADQSCWVLEMTNSKIIGTE